MFSAEYLLEVENEKSINPVQIYGPKWMFREWVNNKKVISDSSKYLA